MDIGEAVVFCHEDWGSSVLWEAAVIGRALPRAHVPNVSLSIAEIEQFWLLFYLFIKKLFLAGYLSELDY